MQVSFSQAPREDSFQYHWWEWSNGQLPRIDETTETHFGTATNPSTSKWRDHELATVGEIPGLQGLPQPGIGEPVFHS